MAIQTPEQAAQAEELRQQLRNSGMPGAAQMADQVTKTVANEHNTLNTMNGEGQDTKYMYGGWAGGADEAARRYRGQADDAQWRTGPQINYGAADGTRSSALGMAGLMAARARGETPSIAGMMADRQMGQAAAEQSSAAASARGPAALALAQQGAAGNTATMQSNISGQAQINAAQERLQAEQAAFGAYSGTSAQDAQRAQAQGALDSTKQGQNDAMTLGMTGFETGVQSAQMNGGMANVAQKAAGAANYQNIVNGRKAGKDAKDGQMLQAGATTAATAAMMMSSDEAKVPVTWGGPAPSTATSTWGTGVGIDPIDHAASQAHAALDGQQAREMTPGPGSFGGGFDSVEHGIGALKRRNAEEVGLIQAKERVGAKLTKKESWMRPSLERRARLDAKQAEPGAAPGGVKPRASSATGHEPTTGERIGGGLAQLGKIFGSAPPPVHQAQIVQAPLGHVQAPTALSDDHTKLAAAWDAGNKAAIDSTRKLASASPEELKRVAGNKTHPASAVAAAVRDTKAGAYDEGDTHATERARSQSDEAKAAKRDADAAWMQKNSVTAPAAPGSPIERPASWGPAPAPEPPPAPAPSWGSMAGRMRAMVSDDRTKDAAGTDRPQVGTLGKQIPHQDMAEFARSMRGVPYAYKEEYAQREGQQPGEVNVGPVAQEMEKSKVGATIVKPDPEGSGMRTLDQSKMVKGLGSVVADQQDQLDEMRSLMARRLGGRR